MRALLCTTVAFALGACADGASNDPALHATMRIADAQFVAGPSPLAQDGPGVASLELLSTTIWPGYADKPLRGSLAAEATAATLALSGDPGYWIVPAGVPDVTTQEFPSFRAISSFSRRLASPAYTLEVRAVDALGRFGPPARQVLTALPIAPSRAPSGELVVTLTWDENADLDLHVLDPLGNEIYHGAPRSAEPNVGFLDVDSNGDCAIDGLRQEDVLWTSGPPSGSYRVRVDTSSLCGRASARWRAEVTLRGELIASATGNALDSDTRGAHDRGAGLLVLGFDVP